MNNEIQDVFIRYRTDVDVPACAELLREVYAVDGYPVEGVNDATSWMYPKGLMSAWVAERSGEVLGHVAVCEPQDDDAAVAILMTRLQITRSKIAVLARLFVGPHARSDGIGQRLASAAFKYAFAENLYAVFDVMEKDHAAIRMYDHLGCVLLGRTSHHTPDGRVVPAVCYAAPGTTLDS